MERTVKTEILIRWVQENGPDGLVRLALKAQVSHSLLAKVRVGRVPKKPLTRQLIARAMGLKEDDVFPLVKNIAA